MAYKTGLDFLQGQRFYLYDMTDFGVYPPSSYPLSTASSGSPTGEAWRWPVTCT